MALNVLVMLNPMHSYSRNVLQGICRYLRAVERWRPSIEPEATAGIFKRLNQFDGIIGSFAKVHIDAFREAGIPHVNVSARFDDRESPRVWCDNAAIGEKAADYFLGQGHRSFAFAGFCGHFYSFQRGEAFARSLAKRGFSCAMHEQDLAEKQVAGEQAARVAAEHEAGMAFVKSLAKPVAVFACNDHRGKHVIDWAVRLGLRVPEDVAVLGVDNDDLQCELADVPLSSMDVNGAQVGFEASKMLQRMMDARTRGAEWREGSPLVKVLPGSVVPRMSSDVMAVQDQDLAEALRYMRAHASEGITVDSILRHVPLSRRTLEMRFRKALGRSPHEEITRLRIERAKEMLVQSDLRLSDVARRCGYRYAHLFSAAFRSEVGMTPTEYRKRLQPTGKK